MLWLILLEPLPTGCIKTCKSKVLRIVWEVVQSFVLGHNCGVTATFFFLQKKTIWISSGTYIVFQQLAVWNKAFLKFSFPLSVTHQCWAAIGENNYLDNDLVFSILWNIFNKCIFLIKLIFSRYILSWLFMSNIVKL